MITHDGRQSGIQLAVTPLGARVLFGMPAGELANWDGDATQVAGGFAAELQDRIRAERSWAGRFAVIDDVLGQRAGGSDADHGWVVGGGRHSGVRPEVAYAWRRLLDSRGAVPVSSLAAETGWSTRHLSAQFRAEFGLSPKATARVFRFDHTRGLLTRAATAGAGVRLADLAAEAGYYDQAQLAADFRSLAGCPPTQWLTEMLGSSSGSMSPGTFHAHVVCDDPDTLFARAVKNGAVVVSELNDKDYGSRDFAVHDPEGNQWSFGTYRGHPR